MNRSLTPEQIREYLEKSETPLLLVMVGQLEVSSSQDLPVDTRARILQDGFSAAAAFYKAMSYLSLLRQVEDSRFETGRSVHVLTERAKCVSKRNLIQSADAAHAAFLLSGELEAWWNLWAICASHVHTYLKIAARVAGVRTNTLDQIAYPYHELRNKMEHLEERVRFTLGSQEKDGKFRYSVKEVDSQQMVASMQWELDERSRVILGDLRVDLTGRGLDRFESAVERLYEEIRANCLQNIVGQLAEANYDSWALDIVLRADERFRTGVGEPGQLRGFPKL